MAKLAETMKAWQYAAFSGKLEESLVRNDSIKSPDRASISKDQLIVEVISTSLNPIDFKLPEAGWLGTMMITRPAIPGMDFCGHVVAKHPSNEITRIGDVIFGGLPHAGSWGGLGQFLLTSISETAPLPKGVKHDDAAAVGTAATTAYQSLLPELDIKGWKVFLNGGSGGVGCWAVQFAKARGAHVTVSCSTANAEFCKGIGADEVIDYKQTDMIQVMSAKGQVFDLVVDNVGTEAVYANCNAYLRPGGWFSQVGVAGLNFNTVSTTLGRILKPVWLNRGIKYKFINQKNAADYFEQIGKWIAEGQVRAIIDQTYDWEDAPAAIANLREGRTRGKIVVHVKDP